MGFSTPINHEFNYPDILAVREYVENIVSFFDKAYRTFKNKVEEDSRKNEAIEYDKRQYAYKETFSYFKIHLSTRVGGYSTYDSESAFKNAVTGGRMNNVTTLKIEADLNFGRGPQGAIEDHKNRFELVFQPYETKFTRDSNYADPEMDTLEEQVKKILEEFPSTKTIFSPE